MSVALFGAGGGDCLHECPGAGGDGGPVVLGHGVFGDEGGASAEAGCAGFDPVCGVFGVDAACGHQADLGEGSENVFDVGGAQAGAGEDFYEICAGGPGAKDFCRCKCAGDAHFAVAFCSGNHVFIERGGDDELRAGGDGVAGSGGVEYGAYAYGGFVAKGIGERFDAGNGFRGGHGEFDGGDAAFQEGAGDLVELVRGLGADDGDDARGEDVLKQLVFMEGHGIFDFKFAICDLKFEI